MPAYPLNEDGYPSHVTIKPAPRPEPDDRRLPEALRLAQCVVELQEAQHDVKTTKRKLLDLQGELDAFETHLEERRMAVREAFDLLDVALREIDPHVLPPNARKVDRPRPAEGWDK
jgi:hypothetical protein